MRQLGLEKSDQENETAINYHIDNLNFDLVILPEHFDEGMVLLKRKLCWDLEDILYVKLRDMSKKENSHPSEANNVKNQTAKQEDLRVEKLHDFYKNWSRADYILYERMNQIFWQKYEQEAYIDEELLYFKETRLKMEEFCQSALENNKKGLSSKNQQVVLNTLNKNSNHTLTIGKSRWNKEFRMDIFKCFLLKSSDSIMKDIFRFRQHPDYCNVTRKDGYCGECMQYCRFPDIQKFIDNVLRIEP